MNLTIQHDNVFKIAIINLNSINNKISYLKHFADDNNISIISVSETWLINTMPSSYVELEGFKFFRGDVHGSIRKHGSGIFISDKFNAVPIEVDLPNLTVVLLSEIETYFISCYRPPSYSVDEDNALKNFIQEFSSGRSVVLMGDLNLPTLRWDDNDVPIGNASSHDRLFLEMFLLLGFKQWVKEPTFLSSGNILDLLFTSEDDLVGEVSVMPPLPGCHHSPVVASLYPPEFVLESVPVERNFMWHKADYGRVSNYFLTIDWDSEFEGLTAAECYEVFLSHVAEARDIYVPVADLNPKKNPWVAKPPRALIVERSQVWASYKRLRSVLGRNHHTVLEIYEVYAALNLQYRNYARNWQRDYECKMANSLKENPKLFHSYVRRRKQGKPSVGPLKVDGVVISNSERVAEVLADYFSEIYGSPGSANVTVDAVHEVSMAQIDISYEAVLGVLRGLDASSSCGPDGVQSRLLKSCADVLAYPLAVIIGRSLSTGSYPTQWSQSCVVPLFKRGSRTTPSNYRAVSLTSVPCKVAERLVVGHIMSFLDSNSVLSPNQFGFRAGRSTEDQLLLFYNDVAKAVDGGQAVDVLFLDFSRAFDMLNHNILLARLVSLGFSGEIVEWVRCFLRGRTMRVSVGGSCSSERDVTSGVPQGSVLGPVLFLLYVNHLMDRVRCSWKAYADDFKICAYEVMDGAEGDSVWDILQLDLDQVNERGMECSLCLSADKCVVMHLGGGRAAEHSEYTLNGLRLKSVSIYKDLGIWVDDRLKFHHHVRVAAGRAGGIMSDLLRSTVCREANFMISLYISHVRPTMDYCCCLWNVGYLGDVRLLESVQRRWTREIGTLRERNYHERLKLLSLHSVYGRMVRMELIKMWKYLRVGSNMEMDCLFERAQYEGTRGHSCKLAVPLSRTEVGRRRFGARAGVIEIWNSLPARAMEVSTVQSFKRILDHHLGEKLFEVV